jgi:hypothetical protein
VWDGQRVFASGGYPQNETVAIELGSRPAQKWKVNQKCYEQSMIVIDGYLYALTDGGILFCWRGSDGKEMWKQRFRGPVSASPIYAGGHLYCANESGSLYVIRPNPEACEVVAENKIGTDSFPSPAVSGDQIFLRVATGGSGARQERLYCFQAAQDQSQQEPSQQEQAPQDELSQDELPQDEAGQEQPARD